MKIDVNVKKLANTKEDRDMYSIKIKSYKQTFEAKLEKSDLRYLIERLDNKIV